MRRHIPPALSDPLRPTQRSPSHPARVVALAPVRLYFKGRSRCLIAPLSPSSPSSPCPFATAPPHPPHTSSIRDKKNMQPSMVCNLMLANVRESAPGGARNSFEVRCLGGGGWGGACCCSAVGWGGAVGWGLAARGGGGVTLRSAVLLGVVQCGRVRACVCPASRVHAFRALFSFWGLFLWSCGRVCVRGKRVCVLQPAHFIQSTSCMPLHHVVLVFLGSP